MPDSPTPEPKAPETPKPMVEETPVVTEHEWTPGDKSTRYKVTCGRMPLRNDKEEIEQQIFYTAYTRKGKDRPVMFTFNGGPGSPSLWLHLGALGPKRVEMPSNGTMPPPPYRLIENPAHWLDLADLVFIDPIGTGYSRALTPEVAKKTWSVQGDVESIGEFIRMWLNRNDRWTSPLYLVGESYGTTRAAGLAGYLVNRGIAFNGIVLVSSILNFQTAEFHQGNDLPYQLFLPTYTATAAYHAKLAPEMLADFPKTLREVCDWAGGDYGAILAQGSRLQGEARSQALAQLSRYTGLSEAFLDRAELRPEIGAFCKELLREEGRTVGRLDSRFKGIDADRNGPRFEHDPSMSAIMPPYTALIHHYTRTELGYETDLEYQVFWGIKEPWEWGKARDGYPDTSEALRQALQKNPHMKVFVASGWYDLATPFFATEYTLDHMRLDPSLRGNFRIAEYEAGHMMYIHEPSLLRLKEDVSGFVRDSQGAAPA